MKGLLIFIISIIGIVLSSTAAWIWHKKVLHKFLLSLFVGLMMVLLLIITIVANYGTLDHPIINLISLLFYVILLIIPPSMYLYVAHYLSKNTLTQILSNNIRHYFPAISLLLINATAFVLLTKHTETSVYFTVAEEVMFYANSIALLFIFLLQNVFYIYLANQKRREQKNQLAELFTYEEGIAFQWIGHFILGYAILIIALYLQTAQVFGSQDWSFALIVVVYVTFILYKGFQHPSFSELIKSAENEEISLIKNAVSEIPIVTESNKNVVVAVPQNEEKSIISEVLQNQIWEKTQQLMQEEKIYMDKELTVYKLAKIADTNSKYLRWTIQKKYGKNFANYVNSFRIQQAKQLLLDPTQEVYNIEYIGEKSGFKSKSSFYSAFKQQTGLTPQAFRKSINLN